MARKSRAGHHATRRVWPRQPRSAAWRGPTAWTRPAEWRGRGARFGCGMRWCEPQHKHTPTTTTQQTFTSKQTTNINDAVRTDAAQHPHPSLLQRSTQITNYVITTTTVNRITIMVESSDHTVQSTQPAGMTADVDSL